jgi:hypothetical protein
MMKHNFLTALSQSALLICAVSSFAAVAERAPVDYTDCFIAYKGCSKFGKDCMPKIEGLDALKTSLTTVLATAPAETVQVVCGSWYPDQKIQTWKWKDASKVSDLQFTFNGYARQWYVVGPNPDAGKPGQAKEVYFGPFSRQDLKVLAKGQAVVDPAVPLRNLSNFTFGLESRVWNSVTMTKAQPTVHAKMIQDLMLNVFGADDSASDDTSP